MKTLELLHNIPKSCTTTLKVTTKMQNPNTKTLNINSKTLNLIQSMKTLELLHNIPKFLTLAQQP
jgi:hypothetical protein